MKKVVLFFGIAAAMALASCGGNSGNTTETTVDSTKVEQKIDADTVVPSPVDSLTVEPVDTTAIPAVEATVNQ